MMKFAPCFLLTAIILPNSIAYVLEKEGQYKSHVGWYPKGNAFGVGPDHVFFAGEWKLP
jgi:hypothetical protein